MKKRPIEAVEVPSTQQKLTKKRKIELLLTAAKELLSTIASDSDEDKDDSDYVEPNAPAVPANITINNFHVFQLKPFINPSLHEELNINREEYREIKDRIIDSVICNLGLGKNRTAIYNEYLALDEVITYDSISTNKNMQKEINDIIIAKKLYLPALKRFIERHASHLPKLSEELLDNNINASFLEELHTRISLICTRKTKKSVKPKKSLKPQVTSINSANVDLLGRPRSPICTSLPSFEEGFARFSYNQNTLNNTTEFNKLPSLNQLLGSLGRESNFRQQIDAPLNTNVSISQPISATQVVDNTEVKLEEIKKVVFSKTIEFFTNKNCLEAYARTRLKSLENVDVTSPLILNYIIDSIIKTKFYMNQINVQIFRHVQINEHEQVYNYICSKTSELEKVLTSFTINPNSNREASFRDRTNVNYVLQQINK
ncbi:MAG: hypothetical protein J0H68_01670 [Sphingobacteriia bacterium]|nr:hypothetical protein [Sphingobacteriia bacterium]